MSLTPVLTQTAILFILILIGFVIKKLNVISDELVKGLSGFTVNVTLPLMIIASMNKEFSMEMLSNSLLILAAGSLGFIVPIILASVFSKLFHIEEPQKGVYKFLIIFSNTAFMGFPIVNAMYGSEGIFYAAIFNILFNVLVWTLGVEIMIKHQLEGKDKASSTISSTLNKLINPGIFSVIIGFLIFISPIKLPTLIVSPLKLIGDTTTPLAMLLVGALLTEVKLGDMFKNYKLFIVSAIRLVILPIVLVLIFSRFKLPPIVSGIVVILSSMPSAAIATIFAKNYDSDYKLASLGVFITTLLNMFTVPLTLYLITTI